MKNLIDERKPFRISHFRISIFGLRIYLVLVFWFLFLVSWFFVSQIMFIFGTQLLHMNPQPSQRFLALDVLRGMTVCFMIIVNTPGNGDTSYAPLNHAAWHGFTPTDL